MFEYIEVSKRKTLTINLGNYVSHSVVKYDSGYNLRPVEEINAFNRFELAENFYSEKSFDTRYINKDDLKRVGKSRIIRDIAFWIDERIPRSYYKWKYRDSDLSSASTDGVTADGLGLIYQFKEGSAVVCKNYKDFVSATDKQKRYIEYLVWNTYYSVKTLDGMTMKEAGQVIDFLLQNTRDIPYCFCNYIEVSLENTSSACVSGETSTSNQRDYIEHLAKEKGYVTGNLDGMTMEEALLIIAFLSGEVLIKPSCFFKYIEY